MHRGLKIAVEDGGEAFVQLNSNSPDAGEAGWRTEPGAGSAIMVNGKRIFNTDTMMALYRAGLASKDEQLGL